MTASRRLTLAKDLPREWNRTQDLISALDAFDDPMIDTVPDVRALATVFQQALAVSKPRNKALLLSRVSELVMDASGPNLYRELQKGILPYFKSLLQSYPMVGRRALKLTRASVMNMLEAVVASDDPEGPALVRWLAIVPGLQRDAQWESIFTHAYFQSPRKAQRYLQNDNNGIPLEESVGLAHLDFANGILNNGLDLRHPYATGAGIKRLAAILGNRSASNASAAVIAVAAVPFMPTKERARLFDLADRHTSTEVRFITAWSKAKVGQEAGFHRLAEFCRSIEFSDRAQRVLKELKAAKWIPRNERDPNNQARKQMIRWLSHGLEFGRGPDRIDLYDTRKLWWPPTDDNRQVWLWKYTFKDWCGKGKDEIGIGMVGSVTFSLFNESTANQRPEEIYALHCCWELGMEKDPRAPKKRSVKAGLKLLKLN